MAYARAIMPTPESYIEWKKHGYEYDDGSRYQECPPPGTRKANA
jgi:hypothetical protein